MYGQVLLKENVSKRKDEINLPKAVGQKVTFQQLRVRKLMCLYLQLDLVYLYLLITQKHDVFQWKLSNLAADVVVRHFTQICRHHGTKYFANF